MCSSQYGSFESPRRASLTSTFKVAETRCSYRRKRTWCTLLHEMLSVLAGVELEVPIFNKIKLTNLKQNMIHVRTHKKIRGRWNVSSRIFYHQKCRSENYCNLLITILLHIITTVIMLQSKCYCKKSHLKIILKWYLFLNICKRFKHI